jgi:hypothetical protein
VVSVQSVRVSRTGTVAVHNHKRSPHTCRVPPPWTCASFSKRVGYLYGGNPATSVPCGPRRAAVCGAWRWRWSAPSGSATADRERARDAKRTVQTARASFSAHSPGARGRASRGAPWRLAPACVVCATPLCRRARPAPRAVPSARPAVCDAYTGVGPQLHPLWVQQTCTNATPPLFGVSRCVVLLQET